MEKELPIGWINVVLEDLFSHVTGGDWGLDPETIGAEGFSKVVCIRGGELRNWRVDKGKTASIRLVKESSINTRSLRIGDILLEISGGGPDQPVGRTVIIDEEVFKNHPELPKVCTNFLRLVRLVDVVNKQYINQYLHYFYSSGEVVKYQGGSNNLRNLKFGDYSSIKIPLPPLPEQQRIVAKLDNLFGHLDALKTRLDRIPQLLKDFRQKVLTQAVTGKLTEEWREGSVLEANEELKTMGMKHFEAGDQYPGSWSSAFVEDYLLNLDSKRVPISQSLRDKRKGSFPYYGATGIIDYIDDYTHDGDFILISEDGKNIVYRNKPLAFPAKGKIWVNNHAHVLQSKGEFKNEFAIYFFNTLDLTDYITGIDQVKLSQKNLNLIEVPIPSSMEQQEIVRRVESLFAKADQIEASYQKLKAKIEQLPQALLAKAFRGELVEQLPTDGDARDLLEQIKQAKAGIEKGGKIKKMKGDEEIRMVAEKRARYEKG